MSFLSSVLSSIETGTPTSLPPITPRPTPDKSEPRKLTPSAPVSTRPTSSNTSAGIKRKAEDSLRRLEKPSSTSNGSANGSDVKARPKAPLPAARPAVAKKPTPPAAPAKPPPKGSFADLMAKAKAVQKEAPKVGVLKHQAALPKEKISKTEMKRRMEAIAKGKEAARPGKRHGVSPAPNAKRVDGKPGFDASAKKREPEENAYKGTARSAQPSYKGTANLPARHKDADRRRAPRRDEYLGTDEEDEGDFYDDYDDYYSDESSDMEAGYGDMEKEEIAALRAAQKEDEEDIRREAEAKRAKMERRQKLTALARAKR
ncbi:conserved hypothetical protein [Talaromyces stipitatus ATCC 10500]|uniref:Chromatin SPT2 n=1 Tax=Talaromyces stipitatus (strain ATCC 10500 / CBS 375.48 / QM 6759 / NRRL 1006) TaxID=441959 RepID=B8MDW2_TALSN|nr:uncharacterized protein TSTA_011490 [Talaromyces stipitatus ATCC 10500]EED16039.1 conserved hypothetical protein [Talaromyces stipitatus ATCC 10500]